MNGERTRVSPTIRHVAVVSTLVSFIVFFALHDTPHTSGFAVRTESHGGDTATVHVDVVCALVAIAAAFVTTSGPVRRFDRPPRGANRNRWLRGPERDRPTRLWIERTSDFLPLLA